MKNLGIIKEIKLIEENEMEGYAIVTDQDTIKILIQNETLCSEKWGYITSEDNISKFIGSEILELSAIDPNNAILNEKIDKLWEDNNPFFERCEVMFLNIQTTNGLLQFVTYNISNGYYGHESCIISKSINEKREL